MSSSGSNAGMETSTTIINAIMPSSITLCFTRTHTSDAASNGFTSCAFSGTLAAPYFIMKYIFTGQFGSQKSGSSYRSATLLHFRTRGTAANVGQNVRVDRARGKDNDQ